MYWKLLTSLLFAGYAWGGVTGHTGGVNGNAPTLPLSRCRIKQNWCIERCVSPIRMAGDRDYPKWELWRRRKQVPRTVHSAVFSKVDNADSNGEQPELFSISTDSHGDLHASVLPAFAWEYHLPIRQIYRAVFRFIYRTCRQVRVCCNSLFAWTHPTASKRHFLDSNYLNWITQVKCWHCSKVSHSEGHIYDYLWHRRALSPKVPGRADAKCALLKPSPRGGPLTISNIGASFGLNGKSISGPSLSKRTSGEIFHAAGLSASAISLRFRSIGERLGGISLFTSRDS